MKLQAILLAAMAGGCTTVRVVQRDGCWVRSTERAGNVSEELGPCARPTPEWADDQLTRLLQECAARADWVWETRAVAAWNHREAQPPQEPQEEVLRRCLADATSTILGENEGLKARLAEATRERDALRASAEKDGDKLRESSDRLAEYLGEAAKRPSPPAVATATASSDGNASAETSGEAASTPPATVVAGAPLAACAPGGAAAPPAGKTDGAGPRVKKAGSERRARRARLPACDPTPVKAADLKPADAKAAEVQASDAKRAEAKPADVKGSAPQAEAKPGAAKQE
jgi:hypothetical protein